MRLVLAIILFALLTGLGAAPSHPERSPHSPNVESATHSPEAPTLGQDVRIEVRLRSAENVSIVKAVYCRVERYACGPSLTAQPIGNAAYAASIPWHPTFFDGVSKVGYQFDIRYYDGTNETTPIEHYPERPAMLPDGGGTYYYYELPRASPALSLVFVIGAIIALASLGARRT
ncbi:MAG TPA: hypothetical protein VI818_01035 [Candidatus Thermoplasmatota archaeon]|nr:hypothetical protein [Candidatus Thermoplasmatota archaeon]